MKHLLMLVAIVAGLSGCGNRSLTDEWFKHPNSYDYRGQRVELRMLTDEDLIAYASNTNPDLKEIWEKRLREDFGIDPELEAAPVILLPIIVEHAISFVRRSLEREATLYEAQFGATMHESGFWKEFRRDSADDPWKGVPRWWGFEIVRHTSRDTEDRRPAFRLVCGVIPATMYRRHGTNTDNDAATLLHRSGVSDERLFVIKPLWLEVNRSRAKVARTGQSIDVTVNIQASSIWIDAGQSVRNDVIAEAAFAFSGVDLEDRRVYINELTNHIAGWFAGVPISFDAGTNVPKGDGTFRLSVFVTENDPSKAREVIERAAIYLEKNQGAITKVISNEN